MKHVKNFSRFLNEDQEIYGQQHIDNFVQNSEAAFYTYTNTLGFYKTEENYDYKNGYVYNIKRMSSDGDGEKLIFKPKDLKILKNANIFNSRYGMPINGIYKFSEPISDAPNIDGEISLWVGGKDRSEYGTMTDSVDWSSESHNFNPFIKKFISNVGKTRIDNKLISDCLYYWDSANSAEIRSASDRVGMGSHSSTRTMKNFDSLYIIKDLDKVFGDRKNIEKIINRHPYFGGSSMTKKLTFDWYTGFMYVGGTYTEVWD